MDDDDEYEQERLANIQRNRDLLKELDLDNGLSSSSKKRGPPSSSNAQSKKKAPRGNAKTAPTPQRVQPRRVSNRLLGVEADSEKERQRYEKEAEAIRDAAEAARRARHEEHDLAFLTGSGEGLEELRGTFEAVARAKVEAEEEDTKDDRELKKLLDSMVLRSADKVTNKRVYSMVFHPNREKDLIFVGDKEGSVGVWDPNAQVEQGEEEEEGVKTGQSWNLQVHGRSPITCLRFDPISATTLYSASYDATIRAQDLHTGISKEFWAGDESVLLSIFDILAPESHPSAFVETPSPMLDERSLWVADHRGGLTHIDMREPSRSSNRRGPSSAQGPPTRRWQVCEKKIGGMSVNQAASSCIAVASLDQCIRLFDVRNLQTIVPTTDEAPHNYRGVDGDELDAAHEKAQISMSQARLACTSVDFDPSGSKLVGVSYDDVVKVWDMDPRWLTSAYDSKPKKNGVVKKKETAPSKRGSLPHYFSKAKKEEEPSSAEIVEEQTPMRPRPDDVLAKPMVTIPHNNQTGKWLTLFRARFNRDPTLEPHFSIGSMKRHAEIWSAKDGKLLRSFYDEDNMTAVPAVTATHPRSGGRLATGNASGRCTFWAPP